MRKFLPVLMLVAVVALLAACSSEGDNNLTSSNSPAILSYMPAQAGYSAYYHEIDADGHSQVVRFHVGDPAQLGSENAREWIYSSSTGDEKVSFIQVKNDCILIYDPTLAATEKILQLPLEPGASWQRYSGSYGVFGDNGGGSDGGTINDQHVNTDTSSTPGGAGGENFSGNNKGYTDDEALGSFPTEGSGEMMVDDIETIELTSGTVYSNAIRISNSGTSGRMNYYWYVQGIGLVKYVINAQSPSDGSGQLVGELLSFSR